jgi:hypothetical protein
MVEQLTLAAGFSSLPFDGPALRPISTRRNAASTDVQITAIPDKDCQI